MTRGGTLGALPSQPPALRSHFRFVSAFEIQVLSEPPLHLKMGLSTVPLLWGCCEGSMREFVKWGLKGQVSSEQRSAYLTDLINAL